MPQLLLHIGIPRTATSLIQSFLAKNAGRLRANGIFLGSRHPRAFAETQAIYDDGRRGEELAKSLIDRSQGAHAILLSDEDLSRRLRLAPLSDFAKHFSGVKVIVALRRQDLWLESWYLQNIKWQWDTALAKLTLRQFLDRRDQFHWIDYDLLMGRLSEFFGDNNIVPFVFEKEMMPGGPVTHFCRLLGINSIDGWTKGDNENVSLSPVYAEFLRQLPLLDFPDPIKVHLEAACLEIHKEAKDNLSPRESSPLLIEHDERQRILDSFESGNRSVARSYFSREALFLEGMPDPTSEIGRLELPPPNELMSRLVAPYVKALVKRVTK
ncbi:hypothetical protein ACFPOD_04825 [Nitratireductor kimnyeongensis]|uniref:Sulfotransferase family protein n=1 Tax=Nitratireductor kimnyeongensis TaxID=430679 RepID=A0ABW0T4Z4_9HYPH|nr:hypothetical protein [Nitratireductor kimnyeongensis]QZZ34592.1 hypothetical protein KW403_12370 [Nitratireductor kimnyeongensis]